VFYQWIKGEVSIGAAKLLKPSIGEVIRPAEHDIIGLVAQKKRDHQYAIAGRVDQEVDIGRRPAVPTVRPDVSPIRPPAATGPRQRGIQEPAK
jgi:hypothetical protein